MTASDDGYAGSYAAKVAAISGLDAYHQVEQGERFSYATRYKTDKDDMSKA